MIVDEDLNDGGTVVEKEEQTFVMRLVQALSGFSSCGVRKQDWFVPVGGLISIAGRVRVVRHARVFSGFVHSTIGAPL